MTQSPDFRSVDFLRVHVAHTIAFYHPRAIDPKGGFFHYFKDDGSVYERDHRHLVSSTRFVFVYAMAFREFARPEYLNAVRHGLEYLRERHRDPRNGGYAWTLRQHQPEDRTNHAYGLAFVLLAYAHAVLAGIADAKPWIVETWDILEKHFWEPAAGLYRDEADEQWNVSPYRGQNSNMHLCEAMLAAYDATHDNRYLQRAGQLADAAANRLAPQGGGLIWEHYHADWTPDWNYNRDDPGHLFRPWGFQPGHQTEWAKLLLMLDAHHPESWRLPAAVRLFEGALENAWDSERGGIYYGFTPDRTICDTDKYFWVQAESIATAARLAIRTQDSRYWEWYEKLWHYSWENFVDHRYGAWYRILNRDNVKYSDEKSPAGKTDYHTVGACFDVMTALRTLSRTPTGTNGARRITPP